jgi:O-antigen/teichoic acid export membrane protein
VTQTAPAGSLRNAALRSVGWATLGQVGSRGFSFVASLALARLLSPTDFGLVASVYVITGFAVVFFELGLGAALVQLPDLTEDDLSTAFWINAAGGVVFALLAVAAAPLVGSFYGQSELDYLTPIAAVSFALTLGICHQARIERRLELRRLTVVQLVASALAWSAAIGAAVAGLGAVALALGPVIQAAITSAGLWLIEPWRPARRFTAASVRRLWAFSAGRVGFNAVNYWSRNADNLLVGRYIGPGALGLYGRAYALMLLPLQQVNAVGGQVMFPALSAMGADVRRVANGFRQAQRSISGASMPLLTGMAAAAPALVPALFGRQWVGMVPILQILCLAGIPQCIGTTVGWIFMSQAKTRLMFTVALCSTIAGVSLMAVGLHWGAKGVAVAIAVRSWLALPPTLEIACRLIGLRSSVVWRDNLPAMLMSATAGGVMWTVPWLTGLDRDGGVTLAVQVALGAAVFVGLAAVARPAFLADVVRTARSAPTA